MANQYTKNGSDDVSLVGFPSPTITQLEEALEERGGVDRRESATDENDHDDERRSSDRRQNP